mmetsp:Transcript_21211/g.38060  ORF Transcript_21211/g.38060 Transcript_21211/m.38060 type:complete len:237 (-) Transcript_21211:157-867(-)
MDDVVQEKRGIIYLSTIPDRMSPGQLRTLLNQFGEVTNMHLVARDTGFRKKTDLWEEGWVEFRKRSVARNTAAALNCTPIGGNSKVRWRDDMWNMKYLKGFQWFQLQEERLMEKRMLHKKFQKEKRHLMDVNDMYLQNKMNEDSQQRTVRASKKHKSRSKGESAHSTDAGNGAGKKTVGALKRKRADSSEGASVSAKVDDRFAMDGRFKALEMSGFKSEGKARKVVRTRPEGDQDD